MSIKPIDYQITYNNTINEAKDRQNQINKVKDTHIFVENQQKYEEEINKSKIQDIKEKNNSKIHTQNKEHRKNKHNLPKKNKKSNGKRKEEDKKEVKDIERKGHKIDIFI